MLMTLIIGGFFAATLATTQRALAEVMIYLMAGLFGLNMLVWMLEDSLSSSFAAHFLTLGNAVGAVCLLQIPIYAGHFSDFPVLARLFQAAFIGNAIYCHYWYYRALHQG